jgi:4-hydroxy-tetrahydrodipicolinate reductase
MILLILGRGKTGSVVAEVARDRGHSVRVIGEEENRDASALTRPLLAQMDAVIDFTTPEAVVHNLRACLSSGAHVVVGTTGWYDRLEEMRALCQRREAAMLYGTNFSIGVQTLLRLARELALSARGYSMHISETHHAGKKDAPSGTALSIQQVMREAVPGLAVEIRSEREGDAAGIHVIEARSESDALTIRHEAFSRRGFAEGAVRGAEWLASRTGCYAFSEVYTQIYEQPA